PQGLPLSSALPPCSIRLSRICPGERAGGARAAGLDARPSYPSRGRFEDRREVAQLGKVQSLILDLEALPLLPRPAPSVPADAVHVAEELQAIPFRVVEVEGVVVARPLVLALAAGVHALREV